MRKITSLLLIVLLACVAKAQQSYDVAFDHDGKTVNAIFTTPNGSGPFTTLIINPGTGPSDRHGTLALTDGNSSCLFPQMFGDTIRMYKDLSDALVAAGYAVLRYDKLEYTYPGSLSPISFHKLWLPVESAIDYVKTRSDVDTTKIVLIGHSEGSALIPYIARGRSDVKALISIAGARTPFDSIYASQLNSLVELLRPCGATATDSANAANQGNQILTYFNIIRSNTWNASTPAAFGVPASVWYDYIRAIDSVAINYNLNNLPTLFTGMGLDIQVKPAELIRFENDVSITNDFWSLPGLTHYMTPLNDPHVSSALTDTIVYWLSKNNLATGIASKQLNDNLIKTYPNPCTNQVTLSMDKPGMNHISVSVLNVFGQTIFQSESISPTDTYTQTIDFSTYSRGVYWLRVTVDGIPSIKKVIRE